MENKCSYFEGASLKVAMYNSFLCWTQW
jgi:hypothetical protein